MTKSSSIHRRGSAVHIFLVALSSSLTRGLVFKFIATVIRDFFFPQFQRRLFPRIRPVTNVDHQLDRLLPFIPGKVGVYLSFVALYLRSLDCIYRRFGRESLPDIASFLADLESCYRDAAGIYRINQSTTTRPRQRTPRFVMIHLLDPHLHCVPSLHVIIMGYCYCAVRRIIQKLKKPSQPAGKEYEEVFQLAMEVTDSVLYIKQHSVNCIAAGLFFMSCKFPWFDKAETSRFIGGLLQEDIVSVQTRKEVRAHIRSLYTRFMRQSATGSRPPCREVLTAFLAGYTPKN